jgi:hypothetical protein
VLLHNQRTVRRGTSASPTRRLRARPESRFA